MPEKNKQQLSWTYRIPIKDLDDSKLYNVDSTGQENLNKDAVIRQFGDNRMAQVKMLFNDEDAYDKYAMEHPTELPELVVTGDNRNWAEKTWDDFTSSVKTSYHSTFDPIVGQQRVDGVNKALDKNPNFFNDWDIVNNINEYANYATAGLLNRISPAQNFGLVRDVWNADDKWGAFSNSWMGNSGIVSPEYAKDHPYLSFMWNTLFDFGSFAGASKIIGGPTRMTSNNITRGANSFLNDSQLWARIHTKYPNNVVLPYVNDIFHPVRTVKAIRTKRYLPFEYWKVGGRSEYLNNLSSSPWMDRIWEGAINRYNSRYDFLSNRYYMPSDDPTRTKVFFNTLRDYPGDLARSAGVYKPSEGSAHVLIHDMASPNVRLPKTRLFQVAGHEVEHGSQGMLLFNNNAWLKPEYLQKLGIPNNNMIILRDPVIAEGQNIYGDLYYGIHDGGHPSRVYYDSQGIPREAEPSFNALLDNNPNFTWEASPGEVMSETAGCIDVYFSKGKPGRLFKELNQEEKNKIIRYISWRFNLTEQRAKEMLTSASNNGYL